MMRDFVTIPSGGAYWLRNATVPATLLTEVPAGAKEPQIRAVNSDEETPIAWIIVDGDRPLNEIWEEVEDVISPRLERVSGVGAVWRFGGQAREVHVLLDQRAMAARGLTIGQVRDAILTENRTTKGGQISEGKSRTVVRTVGEFATLRDVEDIVVRHAGPAGGLVYLRDVAQVRFGYKDRDFAVRTNGIDAIGMGVLRRTGANTIDTMRGIKAEIAYLNERVYQGRGIRLTQVYDETEYIHSSIDLVRENIVDGAVLTLIALLLFLRSIRSSLVVFLSIAVSIVGMFLLMKLMGRSLNVPSLAGIAFAASDGYGVPVIVGVLVVMIGAVALFVYLLIAVAQVRLRRRLEREEPEALTFKMWLFPYLSYVTIAGMVVVIAAMGIDPDTRREFLLSLLIFATILGAYGVTRAVRARRTAATDEARADVPARRGSEFRQALS